MQNIKIDDLNYIRLEESEIQNLERILPDEKLMTGANYQKDIEFGTLHWSAGTYKTAYSHYQIMVGLENDKPFLLVADKDNFLLAYKHSHTWKRNTGNISFSFLGMYNPNYPITEPMINLMSNAVAIFCKKYNISLSKIVDHKYFAILDGYENERWDTALKLKNGFLLTDYVKKLANDILKQKIEVLPKIEKLQTPTYFQDVFKEDWYSVAILDLYKKGLLVGYKENGKNFFKPDLEINRYFTSLLLFSTIDFLAHNLNISLDYGSKKIISEIDNYRDNNKLYSLIEWGILQGNTNRYDLEKNLTRAELSVLLNKTFDFINSKLPKSIPVKNLPDETFLDLSKNHWAYNDIQTCIDKSLLIGYKQIDGHFFKPNEIVLRKTFIVSLYKLFKIFL